jgi:hypothetical protein
MHDSAVTLLVDNQREDSSVDSSAIDRFERPVRRSSPVR